MAINNPWLGLASYEEPKNDGTDYEFCGRDEETLEMVRLIDNNLFVTLYGSSGIGKTSLLRAGVIPILRRKDYFPLYVRLSQEPKEISYAEAIIQRMTNCGLVIEKSANVKHPNSNDRLFLWEYFATTRFLYEGREVYPVIILDQFEEVFREGDKVKAELLLKQIYLLLNDELEMPDKTGWSADTNYRFVASIREDFLFVLEDSIDENSLDLYKNNRYRLRSMKPEQARQVVLVPGKKCIEETEKNAVAERIITLAKRPQSDDIDTLMLSLVCAGTYEKKCGEKITLSDLAIWKNNPMEVYYKDAVKGLSASQIRYIQQHLIREDGSRRRVDADEVKDLLGEATYLQLTRGENRLFAIGDKGQVELLHDQLGMAVYEERRAFEEQERKKKQRRRLLTIIGLSLLFALLGLGVGGYSLKQKRRAENALSAEKTARKMAEKAMKEKEYTIIKLAEAISAKETALLEADKQTRKAENANREKENTIKELEEKNVALAQLNAQLEQEKQRVLEAKWDLLKNEAQATAGNVFNLINTNALAASIIALEKLPSNISNPERPITAEAEALLRNATTSQNRIFEGVQKASFCEDTKKIMINNDVILNIDNGLPVSSVISPNRDITTSEEYFATQKDENIIISNANQMFLIDTLAVGENLSYFKLSPNGKQLFTSYKDSTSIVWDVKNRTSIVTLKGIFGPVKIVEFNPAKKQLFIATPKMAILWDSETGIPTDTLTGINEIVSASYSPNGDFVAAASYWNSAPSIIWKTNGGKEVDRYKIDGLYIKTVKFSPDGNCVLLTVQDNTARIWDVSHIYNIKGDIEEKGIRVLDINNDNNLLYCKNGLIYSSDNHQPIVSSGWLKSASYSHDSKLVAACDDKTIRIWDAISHIAIRDIIGHNDFIRSVSIAPTNDKIVSASEDSTIRFWDIYSGKELYKFREPKGGVMFAQYSPDGKHLVSMTDSVFRIWDINKQEIIYSKKNESNKPVSFSCDGKHVASIRNDSIIVWNVYSGMQVCRFWGRFGIYTITDMEFSPDGEHILVHYENWTSDGESASVIWNWNSGKRIKVLEGYGPAAFSPTGDSIIVAKYGKPILYLLDSKTWERIDSIKTNNSNILKLSFSPDSRYILGMELGGGVTSWDSQGKNKWQFASYSKRRFSHGCFLNDGNNALLAGDDVVIWDIKKGKELVTFERPDNRIYNAAISPNNKYIVTMSYSTREPIVWNVKTGKRIFSLKHTRGVNHVSFSNDSKYIVTACDDNCAFIWDAEKGDTIRSLRNGHTEQVRWASFSPDHKYVVTASWDNTAIVWNAETGKPIRILTHTNNVNTASFSNNGRYILTASGGITDNGNTIVWDFETGKQIKTYKSKFSKNALWGPNDKTIITWDEYSGVKVWDFPPLQKLIDETRERFKDRKLTPEERRKYYLE